MYRLLHIVFVLLTVSLFACSDDEKPGTGGTDAGSDLPAVEDMPRLADNGCPLPADGFCDDEIPCTEDSFTIDPITCEVTCINAARCINDDGCCAPGCNPSNDDDCEPGCGNAYLDPGELCDGDCPETPADCGLSDACETAILVGSAETCDSRCFVLEIDRCENGDGCCPQGCVSENDSECTDDRLEFGDICTSSHQCPDANGAPGICIGVEWKNNQESVCSRSCAGANDCPNGWQCPEDVCLPPCTATDECTVGLTCTSPSIAIPPQYCDYLPWHPGASAPGAACENGFECRGRTDRLGGGCLSEADTGWPDGYCTASICEEDLDCELGRCIAGQCFGPCQTTANCRTGYECNDFFGTGKRICSPPVLTATAGKACESAADCLGTMNGRTCITEFPDGYCSSPCSADVECPFGDRCDPNLGLCVARCSAATGCREGYACVDIGAGTACYPARGGNRSAGSSCTDASQCYSYQGLYPTCLGAADGFAGGYCTAIGCVDDAQCEGDNVCLNLGGTQGQCFLGCETLGESCRPGYLCQDRDGKNVCLPGGGGDRPVGDACSDDSQCTGECVSELEDINALNGYCTQTCGDVEDPECPGGSHCVQGQCFPDCLPMSGVDTCARQGYLCRDLDEDFNFECVPNGGDGTQVSGEICSRDWQCSRPGAICGTLGDGRRVCAVECQMGFCPNGFSCDDSTQLCLPNCTSTTECRTGFTCLPVPGGDGTRFCDYGIFRLGQ